MRRAAPPLAALLIALSLPVPPAFSCGGPKGVDLYAPLAPIESLLQDVVAPSNDIGDSFPIPEMSFLYPFHLTRPEETRDLWNLVDGPGDDWNRYLYMTHQGSGSLNVSGVDPDALFEALRRGDQAVALREARSIVDRVLDMPSVQADRNQDALRRAVEFLELQPAFAGLDGALVVRLLSGELDAVDDTGLPAPIREALVVRRMKRSEAEKLAALHPSSPRLASLRFVALRERLHTDIPEGWRFEIKEAMKAEEWARLEKLHDDWLSAYPRHPLADLVRLSKVRLYYLQGRAADAWDTLLSVYPRRLPRVLYDMRFLLSAGLYPPDLHDPRIDPPLLSALIARVPMLLVAAQKMWMDAADWSACWKIAEAGGKAPWAINMEERLLRRAAEIVKQGDPLPAGFPEAPANPTALWGKMRLYALLQADRRDAAREEAWSLKPDADVARVRARLFLFAHRYAEAAQVEGLVEASRQYLIRVILDDRELAGLSSSSDPAVRREAILARAVRAAGKDDWRTGANLLKTTDPAKAGLWTEAARLRADRSVPGRLAFARFLRDHNGQLFYGSDRPWSRSVGWRLKWLAPDPATAKDFPPLALPWSADFETTAIRVHLTASSEMYRAFLEYAAWLAASGSGNAQARDVLKEADAAYNWLNAYPDTQMSPWAAYLPTTEAAMTVRRVGKELRQ